MVMNGYILDPAKYIICFYTVLFVHFKLYCSKILFKRLMFRRVNAYQVFHKKILGVKTIN